LTQAWSLLALAKEANQAFDPPLPHYVSGKVYEQGKRFRVFRRYECLLRHHKLRKPTLRPILGSYRVDILLIEPLAASSVISSIPHPSIWKPLFGNILEKLGTPGRDNERHKTSTVRSYAHNAIYEGASCVLTVIL